MIFESERRFSPDAVEAEIPDPAVARRLVLQRAPQLEACLERRRGLWLGARNTLDTHRLECADDAIRLAFARLALRHGHWGADLHEYHNEFHVLEILGSRLETMLVRLGVDALPCQDWLLLSLFAACHDLRQREDPDWVHGVGSNEAASCEESTRILNSCGFSPDRDRRWYVALEMMIAGSTFDARPKQAVAYSTAEAAHSGGALAGKLPRKLDRFIPDWESDGDILHGVRLALIAADLDTANVGEALIDLAGSAARLCAEREMRCGRSLDSSESVEPVLEFLTHGQERYFFELHRFVSDRGQTVFGPGKEANAPAVRKLTGFMLERFGPGGTPATCGRMVLDAFLAQARRFSA